MSTRLYTSMELDDPGILVDDLVRDLPEYPSGTLAVLLCDSQVDYGEVASMLKERTNLDIVGGTSLTFPVSDESAEDIGASLLVLDKEGMKFSIAVSEKLDEPKVKEQMKDVFRRCTDGLGEEPLMLFPLLPLIPGFPAGSFITELLEIAGETPVFGGTTTGDLISTKAAVFENGRTYTDRMILVALGGNIRPVFSACNIVSKMSNYAPTVTKSRGSTILQVDDMSFCDYMSSLGIAPEDRVNGVDALLQYGPIPVELDIPGKPDDGVPVVSCISYTKLDEGSATFSRPIPEGTRVGVSILTRDDVEASAAQCLSDLMKGVEEGRSQGFGYDALFCVSCIARYFILLGGENRERLLLSKELPDGLTASGFYGFSEIGPTTEKESGRNINRVHSASIIMCAI